MQLQARSGARFELLIGPIIGFGLSDRVGDRDSSSPSVWRLERTVIRMCIVLT
jgi:hypothetical protein